MTQYRIVHTTRYEFEEEAESATLEARMHARDLPGQTCRFHQLVVTPLSGERHEKLDHFGNHVTAFDVLAAHGRLEVSAINLVERTAAPAPDLDAVAPLDEIKSASAATELRPFLTETPLTVCPPYLAAFGRASFAAGRPLLRGVADLTARVHRDFVYAPGATTVETTAAEVAELGRGVCQDFAHLAVSSLRALGLPARYVSGYLDTSAARGPDALPGADVSHAWFAVHAPGLGWVDFDPTLGTLAGAGHVTLAWGRDYRDVPPLRGAAIGGRKHRLQVSVDMVQEKAA